MSVEEVVESTLLDVNVPVTVNSPSIVVPEVALPMIVAPVASVLVLIFTAWDDSVVPL